MKNKKEVLEMRNITELEGLKKEDMTQEEIAFRDLVIERIISMILHRYFKDQPDGWKDDTTDRLLVYQEEILALCSYGGGMTLGRADEVRRAMGKKKMDLMLSFQDEFVSAWQKNIGIFGNEVWEKIVDYAKYCFNKSHGVCYTQITCKTAELCLPENRTDFMLYNYFNANKPEKKAAAVNHLLETAKLKFPDEKRPFDGMFLICKNDQNIGDIEIKDCRDELPEDMQWALDEEFTMASLFMADLNPSMKFKLICRGIYDKWTLDIRGLALLNKAMGASMKKYNEVPKEIWNDGSLADVLNVLNMWGKFDQLVDTPEMWKILPKKAPRAKKNPDWIYIYKGMNIGLWSSDVTTYRMKQLKKEFSIVKKNGLSMYYDPVIELKEMAEKINNILDKVRNQNPGLKINNKNFQTVMKKVPKLWDRFQMKKKMCEESVFTGYISDKLLLKNGSCLFVFIFANDYTPVKMYTRDPNVMQTFEKGSVVNFRIMINDTVWRGDFKVFSNISM